MSAANLETIHKFLLGEGELKGSWFGEPRLHAQANWWRPLLREAMATAPQAAPAGMVLVPREHNYDEDCNCEQVGYAKGWNAALAAAPAAQVAASVLVNPHTGEPRDYRDVDSDPEGLLCVKPGTPLLAATPAAAVDEGLASKVYDVLCGRNPPQRRHGYPDWKDLSADCREEYVETAAALAVVFRPAQDDVVGCWYGETPREAIDAARVVQPEGLTDG
ncbi:hypothetical protein [Lysobacter capsici]|uniref:hypothetical protein n=1 Tax=Lysobacter capsici TaxID=435897 RepID=UPI001C00077F|nr:hypothetical protein [Lysobacter capsici]QWF19259.1 hypothetical protein KME82_11230 [Lysobacter capsici]